MGVCRTSPKRAPGLLGSASWLGLAAGVLLLSPGEALADCTLNNGAPIGGGAAVTGTGTGDTIVCSTPGSVSEISGLAGADTISISDGTIILTVDGNGGDDRITLSGGTVGGGVTGSGGSDTIVVTGGSILTRLGGGGGDDSIFVSDSTGQVSLAVDLFGDSGNDSIHLENFANTAVEVFGDENGGASDGDDLITLRDASVNGIFGEGGADTIVLGSAGGAGSFLSNNVNAGGGDDSVRITDSTVSGDVLAGSGADEIVFRGGSFAGTLDGGDGPDEIRVGGIVVGEGVTAAGDVRGGSGSDSITVVASEVGDVHGDDNDGDTADDGNDRISLGNASVGSVYGQGGNDTIQIGVNTLAPGGPSELSGTADGGVGDDVLDLSAGTVTGGFAGNTGDDTLTVSGGSIGGDVDGGAGNDQISITGGILTGDIVGGKTATRSRYRALMHPPRGYLPNSTVQTRTSVTTRSRSRMPPRTRSRCWAARTRSQSPMRRCSRSSWATMTIR